MGQWHVRVRTGARDMGVAIARTPLGTTAVRHMDTAFGRVGFGKLAGRIGAYASPASDGMSTASLRRSCMFFSIASG
jgi:hypothetical protein